MALTTAVRREIGRTGRSREVLGAVVLLLGAGAVAACTGVYGFTLYENLAVLGAAATLAWLVDGSAGRYVGAGTIALAIGGGLTLGRLLHVPGYEHMVVFGFAGLALLLVSFINPKAVRGSAGLLLFISMTVAVLEYLASYNGGWELTGILAFWGAVELARITLRPHQGADQASPFVRDEASTKVAAPAAPGLTPPARAPEGQRAPVMSG